MFTSPRNSYEIFIRNSNFDLQGIIGPYDTLDLRVVYNAIGEWSLNMDSASPEAKLLFQLYYANESNGYTGIVVTQNAEIIYSGIITGFDMTSDYDDNNALENIEFYGVSDLGLLAMRVVMVPRTASDKEKKLYNQDRIFASPANQGWDIWQYPENEERNIRSTAQVIHTTVTDNISYNAPKSREIPQLWIKPVGFIGPITVIRGRYQNLLEKIQEIAYLNGDQGFQRVHPQYDGLQFNIMQLKDPINVYNIWAPKDKINQQIPPNVNPPTKQIQQKKLQFTIKEPADKRSTVVFSKGLKTMGGFSFRFTSPQSTHVILGGQNNTGPINNVGPSVNESDPRTRWFAHTSADFNKIQLVQRFGLHETFLDRRDIQFGKGTPQDPYPIIPPGKPPYNPAGQTPARKNYIRMYNEWVQAMESELLEKQATLEIEIKALNLYPCRAFADYNVGDLVTVIIPGYEEWPQVCRVREINLVLSKDNGEEINVVLGTITQPQGNDIFSRISNLRKKVNFLEELR